MSQSTIFQLCRDRSSLVEPVLSKDIIHKSDLENPEIGLNINNPMLTKDNVCLPFFFLHSRGNYMLWIMN